MYSIEPSVAHDINNLLQAALGYVDLAILDDKGTIASLSNARRYMEKVINIIRNDEAEQVSRIDLSLLIEESIYRNPDVAVNVRIEQDARFIRGIAGELSRVFFNLTLNARQAGAREICITAKRADDEGKRVVMIAVCDDGPGFPAEAAKRIFEARFTTKPNGFGIGLATVKSIIGSHGGTIEASSGTAGGSRKGGQFIIRLPVGE